VARTEPTIPRVKTIIPLLTCFLILCISYLLTRVYQAPYKKSIRNAQNFNDRKLKYYSWEAA
jgi:hypothetical protein